MKKKLKLNTETLRTLTPADGQAPYAMNISGKCDSITCYCQTL